MGSNEELRQINIVVRSSLVARIAAIKINVTINHQKFRRWYCFTALINSLHAVGNVFNN